MFRLSWFVIFALILYEAIGDFEGESSQIFPRPKRQTESCGKSLYAPEVKSLIIGGDDFKAGEWPWMAALYWHQDFICGGTILNKKVILTAAHCIQDKSETSPRQAEHCFILVGKHNLNSKYERDYRQFLIREFKLHPSWDQSLHMYEGDVAMVLLETPMTFQHNIKPICLPAKKHSSADIVGKSGTVAGWGFDNLNKVTSGIPKILEVPIASKEECFKSGQDLDLYISHRSFCSTPNIGRSPCKGDSGSSVCFKINGSWTIRGIVSFSPSENCDGNSTVVYTDVAQFADWIEENIPETNAQVPTRSVTTRSRPNPHPTKFFHSFPTTTTERSFSGEKSLALTNECPSGGSGQYCCANGADNPGCCNYNMQGLYCCTKNGVLYSCAAQIT